MTRLTLLCAASVYNVRMISDKDKPQPRRLLQFSITALLVLTTICAILFAWWRDRTQLQQQLEMQLRQAEVERARALESAAEARMAEQMAQRAREEAHAALRRVTSQPTSGQETSAND